MNTRALLSLRLVTLALIALVAAGSCALLEPFTGDSGEADAERPARSEPAEREPDQPAPDEPTEAERQPPDEDAATDDAPAEELPPGPGYDVLARGQQSAVRVPLARAITDATLWADFWAAMTANQPEPPERPEVDFDEEIVIVLLLGERRTGGYAVRIEDVRENRGEIEIVVDVERPEPGEVVTQALTSPYFVATIPASGTPVEFAGDDVEKGFFGD